MQGESTASLLSFHSARRCWRGQRSSPNYGGMRMKECHEIARSKSVRWACWRPLLAVICFGICFGLMTATASAKPDPMAATGSKAAREEAVKAIPWRDLTQQQQRMVQYITRNATLYRRMPTRVFDCDPEIFNFLGQNPEVVTELWRKMGVCNLLLEKTSDNSYRATDSAGTTGSLRILSAKWNENSQNSVLIYAEGTYQGVPFPRPVTARTVLLLRSGSRVETNGRPYVTARLDAFVMVERLGAELVTKTLRPLIVKTADHNFVESMKFVSTFSQTAEENPRGMGRLSQKMPKLSPATQAAMVLVCQQAADRYQQIALVRRDAKVRLAQREEERRSH